MQHVKDRHMPGGRALTPDHKKDLFHDMTESQVGKAIRNAYRHGEVLQSQGERVFIRGPFGNRTIEKWVNKSTKTIETAWPKP